MSRLSLCIKKDRTEYLRSNKLTICIVFLALFMAFVLGLTALVPRLSELISSGTEFMSEGIDAIADFLRSYFPQTLSGSMEFFSTEIGLFYSVLAIAFSFGVLPNEIKSGRLILPTCNGYKQKEIFLSKQLVYALFTSIPAGVSYFLYYLLGSTFLKRDYEIQMALLGAVVTAFNIFCIVCLSVALSVIYKHKIWVIVSLGLTVAASPDILGILPFGKYIPTYIYTYLNYPNKDPMELIIPVIEYIVLIVVLDIVVIKRGFAVIVDERR